MRRPSLVRLLAALLVAGVAASPSPAQAQRFCRGFGYGNLGYGAGYVYDHDAPGGASGQEFLPEAVAGTAWYVPGENARERSIREALRAVWRGKYGY